MNTPLADSKTPPWLRRATYQLALFLANVAVRRPPQARQFELGILKLDRLGDGVLALGATRSILDHHAEKRCLLIVSQISAPLFEREFPEVERLVLPAFCQRFWPDFVRFLWDFIQPLKAVTVDRVICLRHQPSDYLKAVTRLLGARKTHVTQWSEACEAQSLSYPSPEGPPYPTSAITCLELEAHRRLLESVLQRAVKLHDILPKFTSATCTVGTALLICPIAGASLRQYPPHSLAQAVCQFVALNPMPVSLCMPPSADPTPWREALAQFHVEVQHCYQPSNVAGLLTIIANSALILAPDSAPAHLATALDKPGVFLLGGGHFGMFAPWSRSERQQWISQPLVCYHCRWRCIHSEAFCITHILPSQVAQALMETWKHC